MGRQDTEGTQEHQAESQAQKQRPIIALDPGGTTGVVISTNNGATFTKGQLNPDHHLELWDLLTRHLPAIIVCESFSYRKQLDKVDLTPVEYIGLVKLFCAIHPGTNLCLQAPAEVKPLWTDDKLKSLGLWTPGLKHANDAMRHWLHYAVVRSRSHHILKHGEGIRLAERT